LYDEVAPICGKKTAEFLRNRNKRIILLINIESVIAMKRLKTLLSIPGVDGVFIGPHDLSV